MEITPEQVASDVVRNLAEALARLCEANIDSHSIEGCGIRKDIEGKLRRWLEKL